MKNIIIIGIGMIVMLTIVIWQEIQRNKKSQTSVGIDLGYIKPVFVDHKKIAIPCYCPDDGAFGFIPGNANEFKKFYPYGKINEDGSTTIVDEKGQFIKYCFE